MASVTNNVIICIMFQILYKYGSYGDSVIVIISSL